MTRYILRRIGQTAVILYVVLTCVFFFVHLIPGDPAAIILGGVEGNPSPEQIEIVRKELGLDRPIAVQYGHYLSGIINGNLGKSLVGKYDVAGELLARLPRTLQLVLPATILAVLLGIPMGVASAVFRGRLVDPAVTVVALVGYSTPVFIVATLLVLVFSLRFGWLPPSGYADLWTAPARSIARSILPIIALAISPTAITMRMTRSSVLENMAKDYVTTARSKGLRERAVLIKHIVRNSLIPVLTVLGLQVGAMFAGSVIVETVFNWPGISSLLIVAIERRDYPVVQGVVLLVSAIFLLINLMTDLGYAALDPRIRYD